MRKLVTAIALLSATPSAFACAELEHASPRVGAVIPASPREIALDMSEKLDPKGAEIVIDGRKDAASLVQVAGRRMSARVSQPLRPGVHRVLWSVYSQDGHIAAGDYQFVVKP